MRLGSLYVINPQPEANAYESKNTLVAAGRVGHQYVSPRLEQCETHDRRRVGVAHSRTLVEQLLGATFRQLLGEFKTPETA